MLKPAKRGVAHQHGHESVYLKIAGQQILYGRAINHRHFQAKGGTPGCDGLGFGVGQNGGKIVGV
jgi:hypothetical protein